MHRVGYCVCITLGLGWLAAFSAAAQHDPYLTPERKAFLVSIQIALFDDRFAEAESLVTRYRQSDPTDPSGHLFHAGLLLTQMIDREEELSPDHFKALIDTCLEISETCMQARSPRHRAWMHLIRGHAHAYRSLYSSRFGSFTAALNHAFDAKREYERGLREDSTLYDLYFGLGSYHYWKSAKAGILRWIGLFRNDKKKGIRELRLAADSSAVSREASANALIWVYFDCGKFDTARALVDSAMIKYPGGKSFLWPLAQAQFQRRDYAAALTTYSEIRRRLVDQPGNYYNLVECDFYLTRCHAELQQTQQARLAASRLSDYYAALTRRVLDRQQSNVKYLRRMALSDQR